MGTEWWLFEALVLMAGILPNPEQASAVPAAINLHDLRVCSMLDQLCKTGTGMAVCSGCILGICGVLPCPRVLPSFWLINGIGLSRSTAHMSAEWVVCGCRVCQ